ncbi:hypothetical protein PYV61_15980, partial [Roseisolibacter sp. H3M3-2]
MSDAARRRLFWAGVATLVLFELAHVWLVMPLPGSQRLPSLDLAYALHRWRWAERGDGPAVLLAGLDAAGHAPGRRRWGVPAA